MNYADRYFEAMTKAYNIEPNYSGKSNCEFLPGDNFGDWIFRVSHGTHTISTLIPAQGGHNIHYRFIEEVYRPMCAKLSDYREKENAKVNNEAA